MNKTVSIIVAIMIAQAITAQKSIDGLIKAEKDARKAMLPKEKLKVRVPLARCPFVLQT